MTDPRILATRASGIRRRPRSEALCRLDAARALLDHMIEGRTEVDAVTLETTEDLIAAARRWLAEVER